MKTSTIGLYSVLLVLAAVLPAAATAGTATDRLASNSPLELSDQVTPAGEINASRQLRAGIEAYDQGNYSEAFRLFRNISVLGVTEAHFRLGMMYAEGIGTRKSPRQAAYWLKLAASKNFPGAAERLAAVNAAAEGTGMQANYSGF